MCVVTLEELSKICEQEKNLAMFDSFMIANTKIDTKHRIVCSISGGSDSDIMLDIVAKLDVQNKAKYIFFDTGVEYEATKRHLDFLENKYDIKIERMKAITPVPLGCKKYGVPFWSKHVSEMIKRLQRHKFKWEDRPYDELIVDYPLCKSALKWWCNLHGGNSKFNISYVRGLKEYMIAYPPKFKISPDCCKGGKKNNARKFLTEYDADLNILGIRQAEGGIRGAAYKTCYSPAKGSESWDNYRPIFWYTNQDKAQYERVFNVQHSDCYTKYGLDRTGCAGCPFGKNFEWELEVCQQYEPKLYVAINKIFGDAYAYTRGFLKFRDGESL